MGSSIVYVLVMIGYNAVTHNVDSAREMSWHLSHSACLAEEAYQNSRGRSEGYNHQYVCLEVSDFEARARVENAPNQIVRSKHSLGRGGIRVEW